ncbi:MAG: ribosome assembly RNA-binding protein YhbY [Gammaproteobacteria bacterium]|nr:ribosome assembly RNA-binding protein YhbY [Gammaproteobacteria bacterium]
MTLTSSEKKPLRQIAHHLQAVVSIGEQGLSAGVVAETQRALSDHELIKVKLGIADRQLRNECADELAKLCQANVVQCIGKVAVLYRASPKANPKLSNINRYS